jgi:hypothetical protein
MTIYKVTKKKKKSLRTALEQAEVQDIQCLPQAGNKYRKGLRPPLPSGNPLQTHSIHVKVKKKTLNNR